MAKSLHLTGDAAADTLLSEDANALLIGMVLDQQVPMEKAFGGPLEISRRMGGRLDIAAIAASDEDQFVALCSERPAIHRFPGAMAKRVRAVCTVLVEQYDGRAENVWREARTGVDVVAAVSALPGFGPEKAQIFTALLGKQYGVTPPGWREAAGAYGEDAVYRSVADIVDRDSLLRVRETKKAVKAERRASAEKPVGEPAGRDAHQSRDPAQA